MPVSGVDTTSRQHCVLVTGATGSLGSHLVAYAAELPTVKSVICLNRLSTSDATLRQHKALISRGVFLTEEARAKLIVLEANTAQPKLGLNTEEFEHLVCNVTHIIHNAWPMSITRPTKAFEPQFQVMRNLINLANDISGRHGGHGGKVSFQYISSIATVGCHAWRRVTEEPVAARSTMPTGYGDAKLVCEQLLATTLGQSPETFRSMTVRIGQISGSQSSGYWNPVEHFAFLIKSSQTIKALPDFSGTLSWCPVDVAAATLGELLLADNSPNAVYHIENPERQPWKEMIPLLAEQLGVPNSGIIPFSEWIDLVRSFPGSAETENPAVKLIDFLEQHFIRMSCGNLILDTTKSTEHSPTLAATGRLGDDLVRKYMREWKRVGFLS